MKITNLNIENFRGVKSATFHFHERLNIFVGENGVGKTTILDCLAILLSRLTWPIVASSTKGRFFTEGDISHGAKVTKNNISVNIFDKKYFWSHVKSTMFNKKATSNNVNLKKLIEYIRETISQDNKASLPLAVFYPTTRSVINVPLKARKPHKYDQVAALANSLLGKQESLDFRLFFEWFRNREDVENELYRDYLKQTEGPLPLDIQDPQLTIVRKVVQMLMPGFDNLRVKRNPSLHMVINKGGEKFRIEELSDGEKCLLALVADMARRIVMANPSMDNPLEAEAVFLIDEIDLHLHPTWQRMIVPRLLEVFPNSQFFITTHSPQVLGEIRDTESIWILHPNHPPYHPNRAYGLNSNEVLREIMRAKDRSPYVDEHLEEIASLIDDEKFDDARFAIQELAKETKDIPAILRMNSLLHMYGEKKAKLPY